MYKTTNKIIAAVLVFIITVAQLSLIGIYGKGVYALDLSLENQDSKTNNANVEFDAYLMEENTKIHTSTKTIGESNLIYASLTVKQTGYLKNAEIKTENANFKFINNVQNKNIQSIEQNKIKLNQINNGNMQTLEIPIEFINEEKILATELSRQSKVILTGTYVDANGVDNNIQKEILINLKWNKEAKLETTQELTTFVPYTVGENEGVLLEQTVKTNIENNTMPVKTTQITVVTPQIDGIKPENVKVYAITTEATNGEKTGVNLSSENYTYNKETGNVTINVQNQIDENGKINWAKNAQDEYKIIYTYGKSAKDALTAAKDAGQILQITLDTTTKTKLYDINNTTLTKHVTQTENLIENIGNINSIAIQRVSEDLSKGYIYANYLASQKQETNYEEELSVEIKSTDLTDKITIEQEADKFGENLSTNSTYYKKLTLDLDMVDKILSEDAKIKIYSSNTLIATIERNIQSEENKLTTKYILVNELDKTKIEFNGSMDLSKYNIGSIKIETSKPQTEGKLIFKLEKAIKGSTEYTKAQMQNVQTIELSAKLTTLKNDIKAEESTAKNAINFVEPQTVADLEINKTNLSTVIKNENVELKAILKTDSINNMLYKNPTLIIRLPKQIEKIDLKEVKLMFDEELKIKSQKVVENADGTKSIVIELQGEQTKYSINSVTGGANVIITADLTVNKFTSNKTENVTLIYTNQNDVIVARTEKAVEKQINFVAPTGIVTTNKVINYTDNSETLALNGEDQEILIQTMVPSREVKFEMSFINNYNNTIDNTVVLGRIPAKEIENSTYSMNLKDAIKVSGIEEARVTIYYSNKVNATKDLNNTSNGWTTSPENYAEVKSYLIVINGAINQADSINFAYTAILPENLDFNNKAEENYTVYFNNNLETGTIEDKEVSANITITTGRGPVLETTINSNIPENNIVYTDGIIKYEITVKNTGTKEASNVVVQFNVPKNTTYIEYTDIENGKYTAKLDKQVQYNIGTLEAGQSKKIDAYVKVGLLLIPEGESEIVQTQASASAIANELKAGANSNIVKNTLKNAKYYIDINQELNYENGLYYAPEIEEQKEFKYTFNILARSSNVETQNTILTTKIPEGLTYKDVNVTTGQENVSAKPNYNAQTRELTLNIGKITSSNKTKVTITTQVENLAQNEYFKIFNISGTVSSSGIEETSTVKQFKVEKEGLEIIQSANIPNGSTISAGEQITYTVTLNNIGSKDINVKLKSTLPKGLIYNGATYEVDGNKINLVNKQNGIDYSIYIGKGETKIVKINAIAQIVSKDTKVTNSVIGATDNLQVKSNEITYTIETTKFSSQNIEQGEESTTTTTIAKIGGVIWKDENKNGIKEDNENLISGVELMLYDANANKVFVQNGAAVKATTNENGVYTFNNIPAGNYYVIFLYDSTKYSATTYRLNGQEDSLTSDAIDTKVILEGKEKVAAVTDTITLGESNIYNIDLGIIDSPKFDLSLTKEISKVTVQNDEGTKVYEYGENISLAKVEIPSKYINGTTILVEYKINVKNQGAVEGYVKKIVDYLPEEMSFISELNRDWYINENGAIYNSSLANTKIMPGETKQVILTLTKVVNEDNLGTISNTAEIFETYNEKALEDYDSIPANRVSTEDDIGRADLVISIKTGEYVMFIGLTLAIILSIGIGAYYIKKKVLR